MKHYAVGVDLGGTSIKAALVEQGVGLVRESTSPTEAYEGPEHVIDRVAGLVRELAAYAPADAIAGVGIGSPGAINWDRTTVSQPPNFPGWGVIDLHAALTSRLGQPLPIVVENDANVAGLGSAHYGAGRPYDCFLMVTLGTGVGGAIIYRNTIFRGSTGAAGEIGHMTIDYEGPYARSGVAGAIEAYLGQQFLSHHARFQLLDRKDSLIHDLAGPDLVDITPKMLYEAAHAGDQAASDVLAWAGHKLGCVLGSAVNLLDIRKIIVGGGVSAAGEYILGAARETLPRYVTGGLREGVEIIRETLGNEAGMLGAAHLAFELLDNHVPSAARR